MKKLFFLAILPALITTTAFGQGTVNFANGLPSLILVTNPVTHTTTLGGTSSGVTVELFYQPGGGSAPTPIVSSGINGPVNLGAWEATAGSNPFHLTGGNGRFAAGGQTTGTDVAGGANAWFTVIGWTGGEATLDAAVADGEAISESTIFELTTGNPNSIPPGTPVSLTASTPTTGFVAGTPFNGVTLIPPIPEPSTIALCTLGATTLLFFRRRGQPKN